MTRSLGFSSRYVAVGPLDAELSFFSIQAVEDAPPLPSKRCAGADRVSGFSHPRCPVAVPIFL